MVRATSIPCSWVQNLDWIRCNLPRCIDTPHLDEDETRSLLELWDYTRAIVLEGKYELVVLDELSLAVNFGLIADTEVLAFLRGVRVMWMSFLQAQKCRDRSSTWQIKSPSFAVAISLNETLWICPRSCYILRTRFCFRGQTSVLKNDKWITEQAKLGI